VNSSVYGYDGSLMSSINSYPQYRKYFGFPLVKGTPTTGIVFAIYPIGSLVGFGFAGPCSDIWGTYILYYCYEYS
jgi:MFS family permease